MTFNIYIKKHFVFYSEFDWEPVELLEDVVVVVLGGGGQREGRGVTVVNTGGDEAVDEDSGGVYLIYKTMCLHYYKMQESIVCNTTTFELSASGCFRLTFDCYQDGAVGLSRHVGCITGVEAIISLLAVEDLEDEVLGMVLINDVPATFADVGSILPPGDVRFGVTGHEAAEFGVFAFGHRAGTSEHAFGQLRQSGCPQLVFQPQAAQPVCDSGGRDRAFF